MREELAHTCWGAAVVHATAQSDGHLGSKRAVPSRRHCDTISQTRRRLLGYATSQRGIGKTASTCLQLWVIVTKADQKL